MTATKRCPRCDEVRSVDAFYRRRRGRRLSSYCQSYCQSCSRTASREARRRRCQDPATAGQLRAVDRVRQRRHRALAGQDGGDS